MDIETISIRQVGRTFAAELVGLDLSRPLDKRALADLIGALDRYGVVVFSDQHLTPELQVQFSERLGVLEDSDEGNPKAQEMRSKHKFTDQRVSEISNLVDGEALLAEDDRRRFYQFANQVWHSDSTFRPVRARYTMLLAVKIPSQGGDTEFADMAGAYDALPQDLKDDIEGLNGVHSPSSVMDFLGVTRPDSGGFETSYKNVQIRPLVDVHPGSGRKVLNIGSHCSHVEGMSLPEGRALLMELRERATQREFVYRHAWKPGQLVIWDDRSTLHRACRYKERAEPRQLVRTVISDL